MTTKGKLKQVERGVSISKPCVMVVMDRCVVGRLWCHRGHGGCQRLSQCNIRHQIPPGRGCDRGENWILATFIRWVGGVLRFGGIHALHLEQGTIKWPLALGFTSQSKYMFLQVNWSLLTTHRKWMWLSVNKCEPSCFLPPSIVQGVPQSSWDRLPSWPLSRGRMNESNNWPLCDNISFMATWCSADWNKDTGLI